jgi:hypothetical protein
MLVRNAMTSWLSVDLELGDALDFEGRARADGARVLRWHDAELGVRLEARTSISFHISNLFSNSQIRPIEGGYSARSWIRLLRASR